MKALSRDKAVPYNEVDNFRKVCDQKQVRSRKYHFEVKKIPFWLCAKWDLVFQYLSRDDDAFPHFEDVFHRMWNRCRQDDAKGNKKILDKRDIKLTPKQHTVLRQK